MFKKEQFQTRKRPEIKSTSMGIRPQSRAASKSLDGACVGVGVGELSALSGILDSARLPMAIMAGAGHIVVYVNPALCHLTGKSRESILGKAFAELLPEGDKCLLHLDQVYRSGKVESHTEKEHAEPHPLYWSYEIWPVRDKPGEGDPPTGVMIQVTETATFKRRAIAMNEALLVSAMRQQELMEVANTHLQAEIKERKQAQKELLRSQMLANAGRLAASIAHEINNPLEAVMNTLYLAQTTTGLPEAARDYLETANGELNRIAHITRQTLGFYRESAAASTNSVSALMASVVDLLRARIKSTGATIVQQCEGELQVMGVSGELRQVLANLLANSLDAVEKKGGIVKLRCSKLQSPRTSQHYIRVTVADNGKGIDVATMEHIFEPFFTTKGSVGTGLGLWVSKQLVDKNGGSIQVRSSTEGERRGTTFSVILPAFAQDQTDLGLRDQPGNSVL